MRVFVFGLVALVPTLVPALTPAVALAAGGKAQPADKHEPAVFLDFGSAWLNVVGYDHDYSVSSAFRIYGATSATDRLRMDWKSQGKVLGSAKCESSYYEKGKTLSGLCSMENHATAIGPIDADLIYIDDQTDTEYLVTTLHVTVRSWKGIGKFQNFGILPDDLLAAGFVRHWYGDQSDSYYHTPLFEFWSTATMIGEAQFRCTIDGKKLPDFNVHMDGAHGSGQNEIQVSVTTEKEHRTYLYEHLEVEPQFRFGSKKEPGLLDPERVYWLEDHPGKWDCMLRRDGHQIREFIFTVNDKGMIEQSDMQTGKHPVPGLSNVVMIDMKIPADNGVEKRIRPDAMKKSIGFGVPWPDGPNVKEIQAAFPPASGLPD